MSSVYAASGEAWLSVIATLELFCACAPVRSISRNKAALTQQPLVTHPLLAPGLLLRAQPP